MSVTINGTSGLTFNDATTQTTSAFYGGLGFRNRIINGAMMIDQRNAGASFTTTSNAYTLDRWVSINSATSKYTVQQNAGSVTPPAGFSNYLGCTSTAATTVSSGDYYHLSQPIEGFNTADLAWGTASAASVTLSFWVRSSLTGTFGGALRNAATNRSYPFSFTVSSANTWEQKSLTVTGDTTGTWVTNNGIGILLTFSLGTGSTYSGTAGSWQAGNLASATGATNVVSTNGATFYITGVQLEKGSTATSFDYRPYGTELQLCQRYFETSFNGAVSVNNTDNTGALGWGGGAVTATTSWIGVASNFYKVTKRTAATITIYDLATPRNTGALHRFQLGVSGNNNQNAIVGNNGIYGFEVYSNGSASGTGINFLWSASAEL